jgi:hypothetical protein
MTWYFRQLHFVIRIGCWLFLQKLLVTRIQAELPMAIVQSGNSGEMNQR